MQLVRFQQGGNEAKLGVLEDGKVFPVTWQRPNLRLCDVLEAADPVRLAGELRDACAQWIAVADVRLLAPIDAQEVWAAGVTYKRSKTARMDESEGAARFYDLVYTAPRPELFFKATPHRTVGPLEPVRIRRDAKWNVPEPEFALVLNSRLELIGCTIGNDMSSRDIEGENPLYLPQAKVYDGCCALGPAVTFFADLPPLPEVGIGVKIVRQGASVFEGRTDLGQMARTFEDLIGYLGRDNSFPNGAIMLTGTGVVPPNDFTLAAGDLVEITIDGIGTLVNPVQQGGSTPLL
jgi:2-dehydro-3-deoxy-D-arabinonate dehydratase